jgi:hypothetical protein
MHILDVQYVTEVGPKPICTLLPLYRQICISLYFRVMKIVGIESWNFRIQLFNSMRKDNSTKPCSKSLYSFSKTYLTADCRCKVSQNHIDPHARERVFHHNEMCGRDLLHDQCKAKGHLCGGPEICYTGIFSFVLFKLTL